MGDSARGSNRRSMARGQPWFDVRCCGCCRLYWLVVISQKVMLGVRYLPGRFGGKRTVRLMGTCYVEMCWVSNVLDVVWQWALRVLYLSFALIRT